MTRGERSRHAGRLAATGLLLVVSVAHAQQREAAPAGRDTVLRAYGSCPAELDGPTDAPGVDWGDTLAAVDSLRTSPAGGAASLPATDSLVRIGDRAFSRGRHTTAYAAYASAAREADGAGYEALWKAARAAVDVGLDLGRETAAGWYALADEHARRAIQLEPGRPEGHLHLARALGLVALDANPRERVRLSNEIRAEGRVTLEADSGYAGGWHVLARWNAEVMRLSGPARFFARTFLGGEVMSEASWRDAERYMARAAELEPRRILHHLELGKIYRETGRPDRAGAALRRTLELAALDYHDCVYQREARELLAAIDEGA